MMRTGLAVTTALVALSVTASIARAQATQAAPPEPQQVAEKPAELLTRVYDLRDLMMNVGDYPFAGKIGAPAGREVMVVGDQGAKPATQPSRAERVDQLIKLILDTVNIDTWRDNGGTIGAIREISGLLVVTQTADAHKQIETLLGQLREDHLRTVRVQADWISLTPEQAIALLPADQKSDGKVAARAIDPAALAKLPPDATKFHAELSCFSGQTVSIASGRSHSAITDQEPVVAQDAVAYNPEITQVRVGAMLEVTPTLETTLDTAVVDVRSQVVDWSEPTEADQMPRQTSASKQAVGSDLRVVVERLNLLNQDFRTTARLPVGKPILVGGMTSEPSQTGPASNQLYLVLQLTAGK
jgi:hypothetical protein